MFLLIFSSLTSILEPCHVVDKEALLEFKSKIISDPSNLLDSWTPSSDCCHNWEGIACGSTGRVINLTRTGVVFDVDDIPLETYMSGTLSPYLGNLSSLQVLDLSNLKHLHGSIPPELAELSHLRKLFLYSNEFSGGVPASFEKLSRLQSLYLDNNQLFGNVPFSVFASLKSLSELGLSGNKLSGGFLLPLEEWHFSLGFTFIKTIFMEAFLLALEIFLAENKLTGVLPYSVGKLRNVQRVILENNKLTGKLPSTIGHLASLTDLFLANNEFSGKIPPSFGHLNNLQTLDLSRNQLSGPLPPQLAKLQSLQTLDLSFNPLELAKVPNWVSKLRVFQLKLAKTGIKGQLPKWLAYSSVSTLDLSSNALTGKLPWWIGNMTRLSFLNLSNNEFHSSIPVAFKGLSSLMDLDLHSNKLTGSLRVVFEKEVQFSLGHFNSLDLSNNKFCGPIDDNIGQKASMSSIIYLALSHNPLGGSIPKSIGKLRELEILDLEDCELSGNIPEELGDAETLTKINLSKNKLSGSIPEKVLNLKKLEEFDVSRNRLRGRIPPHKAMFPISAFVGNRGLCGPPLPPCKLSYR
ncbi:hypothetical protein ACSQ67_007745 [Phaseolus vulgaris]